MSYLLKYEKKNLFLLFRFDLNQNELDWKCVNWIIQLSCFIWPLYVTNTVLPLFSNWWGLQGYFQNFQQILTISPQTVLVNFLGGQTVINECLVKKSVFLFLIQHILKKNQTNYELTQCPSLTIVLELFKMR